MTASAAIGSAVSFCGLELEHPIVNGSGTFDAIAARRVFGDALDAQFPFAAYVSKTITLEPRAGNPPPRLWELASGMINSIGLPNKGLAGFIEHDLPELESLPCPLIVSVMGFTTDELCVLVQRLDEFKAIAALELNFSCPNVKTGTMIGADPDEIAAAVARLRSLTAKPLIAKLTPIADRLTAVASSAEAAGCDALSLINTLPGMAEAPDGSGPWLGARTGGVSGPAVRATALAQVAAVATAVTIPIVGMGGVSSGMHARALVNAGATLVAVGTENFRDPAAATRIAAELDALVQIDT